jgi:hypothetical protein
MPELRATTSTAMSGRPQVRNAAASRAAFIEDVEFLADTGERWSNALRRMGYEGRPDSMERRLHRAGRYDLVTRLRDREADDVIAERTRRQRTRHDLAA